MAANTRFVRRAAKGIIGSPSPCCTADSSTPSAEVDATAREAEFRERGLKFRERAPVVDVRRDAAVLRDRRKGYLARRTMDSPDSPITFEGSVR